LTHKNKVLNNTIGEYERQSVICKEIFLKKTIDYGTSWRVLRMISITDQLFIKAQRIRTIQLGGVQKVPDDLAGEFRAIVNYGVIGLIQLQLATEVIEDLPADSAGNLYDEQMKKVAATMQDKNHDYGEAWREMSQESFVDLILMKLLRIRQILANNGKTLISEGIDSNLEDIINYSLFALIRAEEGKRQS
jgi:Nucleotide modification associated domain 1